MVLLVSLHKTHSMQSSRNRLKSGCTIYPSALASLQPIPPPPQYCTPLGIGHLGCLFSWLHSCILVLHLLNLITGPAMNLSLTLHPADLLGCGDSVFIPDPNSGRGAVLCCSLTSGASTSTDSGSICQFKTPGPASHTW